MVFNCEIRDAEFYRSGSITITEISDVEVKTQFLEGRSAQNFDNTFDEIYLNDLYLGYPDDRNPNHYKPKDALRPYPANKWVPLPWVNNSYGTMHNTVTVDVGSLSYTEFAQTMAQLTFQPYLLYILEKICEVVGYKGDFSQLRASRFVNLLICNTLPSSREAWNFAIALPHWSLTELFEQLENFLAREFDIDHKNRTGSNENWVLSEDGTVSGGDDYIWSGVTENTRGHDGIDYDAGDLAQGTASYAIGKGEKDRSEDYFSCIYMGIWDGRYYHIPYQPHPVVDFIEVRDDFSTVEAEEYSLRLDSGMRSIGGDGMKNIDGKKKYHFSFLSDSVPSPRSVFFINGGRYVCEKLTATFHESGRSRLMKGIFYTCWRN